MPEQILKNDGIILYEKTRQYVDEPHGREYIYIVLRRWNDATPFVIHRWRKSMGFYSGDYLHKGISLEEATELFHKTVM
jgi:hypothetical protein